MIGNTAACPGSYPVRQYEVAPRATKGALIRTLVALAEELATTRDELAHYKEREAFFRTIYQPRSV